MNQLKKINCIHYCGYSNCAHPDKGWMIWGKGCILSGDGFASECKNKTENQPPTVRAIDPDMYKPGSIMLDPKIHDLISSQNRKSKVPDKPNISPMPPPKRKICEDILSPPGKRPKAPPMPEGPNVISKCLHCGDKAKYYNSSRRKNLCNDCNLRITYRDLSFIKDSNKLIGGDNQGGKDGKSLCAKCEVKT